MDDGLNDRRTKDADMGVGMLAFPLRQSYIGTMVLYRFCIRTSLYIRVDADLLCLLRSRSS